MSVEDLVVDEMADEISMLKSELAQTRKTIEKVKDEIDHAVFNGHRLSTNCQGVGYGEHLPAVRVDYLRAALGSVL